MKNPMRITKAAGGYSASGVLLQPLVEGSYLRVVWYDHAARVQLVAGGFVVATVDVPRRETRTQAARLEFAERLGLVDE